MKLPCHNVIVSLRQNDTRSTHEYFVVAKHDFYLEDAKRSFAALGIEIKIGKHLEDLRGDILGVQIIALYLYLTTQKLLI